MRRHIFLVFGLVAILGGGLLAENSSVKPSDVSAIESGIYVSSNGKILLTDLSRPDAGKVTAKNTFKVGLGGQKITSRIDGATSSTRVGSDVQFVFKGRDFDPGDYYLVRLDQKRDSREVIVGKNGFTGKTSEIPDKIKVDVSSSEKIADGVYSVVPMEKMKPGEYGFIERNSLQASRIYTFAIE